MLRTNWAICIKTNKEPQDKAIATKWYRMAAEQGFESAQGNLSDLSGKAKCKFQNWGLTKRTNRVNLIWEKN